jgi:hypothetical protein
VDLPETYAEFEDDLVECSARLIAFAGDSDLVFVGRSPHAIFDFLSGLLLRTSWDNRLRLLNISLRWSRPTDDQLRALYPYLAEVGLEPASLARRERPIALVDVVDTGETFGNLVEIIAAWADSTTVEWRAVSRKLRIVGVTWREKTSPKTWRWQQHAAWVERRRLDEIKNVSAPLRFATFLAADAPKTSGSFHPDRWGREEAAVPWRHHESRQALAFAVHLFDLGRNGDMRRRFARALADQPAMTEPWFRSLILELKR